MSGILSLLGAAGNGLMRGQVMAAQARQQQAAAERERQEKLAMQALQQQLVQSQITENQAQAAHLTQPPKPEAPREYKPTSYEEAVRFYRATHPQHPAAGATTAGGGAGGPTPAQARQDEAHEAEGLAFLGQGADTRTAGFGRAFQNIRAQHPDWSPGRVAYYAKTGVPAAAKATASAAGTPGAPGGAPTLQEGERKNAALLTMAEGAYGALESHAAPSAMGKVAGMIPGVGHALQGAIAPEQQALEQSAYQLADAYLRLVSGANLPESEVRGFAKAFVPQPGDSPATQAQKAQSRKDLIHAIRIAAGRGGELVPERVPQTAGPTATAPGQTAGHDVYAQWGITPPGGR